MTYPVSTGVVDKQSKSATSSFIVQEGHYEFDCRWTPLKYCNTCVKRLTPWVVRYHDIGAAPTKWYRVCALCMTAAQRHAFEEGY